MFLQPKELWDLSALGHCTITPIPMWDRHFGRLRDMNVGHEWARSPGSIVRAVWRCGKPFCHCAQPDDPGHGPNLRLTWVSRRVT
ncbi:hypothetical protein SBA4_3180015 [Candidatus Sulfopaludibacter sp. SbA4]|nr:hypothetical protein SBA4_3180015 [Candidatus Sulfopaludibacter sp. SbA4]